MSFQEQERALFDLLFDRTLRKNFCENPGAAFSNYALEAHELDDFRTIRSDAIELDASMRTYLILTQICREFPLTFSLISSLEGGKNLLQELINLHTMRRHPRERAAAYGSQLRERLLACQFDSGTEQVTMTAILEAELGMVWTATTLKQKILEGEGSAANISPEESNNSLDRPVKLAAYVSATMVPQSYVQLKAALCPGADTALWAHISKQPLSASLRKKTLAQEDPRLFVTRAHVSKFSRCEPTVDHQTAELAEGFAPLFQHVNGSMSIARISNHLQQAGAPEEILRSVRAGFQQLLTNGMLELA